MPYTGSGAAITRVETELKKMVAAKGDFFFDTDDPQKLGWNIRNAIKASRKLGIKSYAALEKKYILRIRNGRLKCELRDSLEHVFTVKEFDHITGPLGIIQLCIDNYADEFRFLQTGNLNKSQLTIIYNWASANERTISYDDVRNEGYLIITNQVNNKKWEPI